MARVNKGSTLFRPIKKPAPRPAGALAGSSSGISKPTDNDTIAPATPRATQATAPLSAQTQTQVPGQVQSQTQGQAQVPLHPRAQNGVMAPPAADGTSLQLPPTPAATQPTPAPAPKKKPSLVAAAAASPAPEDAREFIPRPGSMRRSVSVTPRERERSRFTSVTPVRQTEEDEAAVPLGRPGMRASVPGPRLASAAAQSDDDDDEAVPLGRPGEAFTRRQQTSPVPATSSKRDLPAFNTNVGKTSSVNSIPNAASSSRASPAPVPPPAPRMTPLVFKKRADGSIAAVPDPAGPSRPVGRPPRTAEQIAEARRAREENGGQDKKTAAPKRPRVRKGQSATPSVALGSGSGSEAESDTESTVLVRTQRKRRKGIPNDQVDLGVLEANEMLGEEPDLESMSMAELTRAHDFGRISARALTIQERKAEQHEKKAEEKKKKNAKRARMVRLGELRQIKIRNHMRKQRRLEVERGTAQEVDVEMGVSEDEDESVAQATSDEDAEMEDEDDNDEEAKAERKRRRLALMPTHEPAKKPEEENEGEGEEEEMDLENMEFEDDDEAPYWDAELDDWVNPVLQRAAAKRAEREQEQDDIINDEDAEVETVRDTDVWVNSSSFLPKGKSARGRRWNKQETEALYMALSMFGESASIIHQTIFHYMTLGQVKGKLRRENLDRPDKVTMALKNKVKLDRGLLESILGLKLDKKTEHEKALPNARKEELQDMGNDEEEEEEGDEGVKVAPSAEPPVTQHDPPAATEPQDDVSKEGKQPLFLPGLQEAEEESVEDLPTPLNLTRGLR